MPHTDGTSDASPRRQVEIRLNSNQVKAELRIPAGYKGELSIPTCIEMFAEIGVPATRQLAMAIKDGLIRFRKSPNEPVSIRIEGRLPINGINGRLAWSDDLKANMKADPNAPTGYQFQGVDVAEGQVIAQAFPPQPGTNGKTVTGEVLKAKRPKDIPVTPDGMSIVSNDKGHWIAQVEGKLGLDNTIIGVLPADLDADFLEDAPSGSDESPADQPTADGEVTDFELTISDDKCRAVLRIPKGTPPANLNAEQCLATFIAAGIPSNDQLKTLVANAVRRYQKDPSPTNAMISVEGTQAIDGVDGYIEWSNDILAAEDEELLDEQRRNARPRFVATPLTQGMLVGQMVLPQVGSEGLDVFGRPIAAKPAQPCRTEIDPDTIFTDGDGYMYANDPGPIAIYGNVLTIGDKPDYIDQHAESESTAEPSDQAETTPSDDAPELITEALITSDSVTTPPRSDRKAIRDVFVTLAPDAMRAEILIPVGYPVKELSIEYVKEKVEDKKIHTSESVMEGLRNGIAKFREKPDNEVRVVLTGIAAEDGRDGQLKWNAGCDPTRPEEPISTDDSDQLDFYSVSPYCLVDEGQALAQTRPPTDGTDGVNLKGLTLKARSGRPIPFSHDASIFTDDEGNWFAELDGALSIEDQMARVRKLLQVDGFVDFHTGNIDFDGDVEIGAGVRDRFIVKASGHVVVKGLIEAATIECGDDLLAAGIASKERGMITIGGELKARYLNNVQGEVVGNAFVEREIINCNMTFGEQLTLTRGSVIGGKITTAGKTKLWQIGSDIGEKTHLELGYVPAEKEIRSLKVREQQLDKEIDDLKPQLFQLEGQVSRGLEPDSPRMVRYRDMVAKMDELVEERRTVINRRDECEEEVKARRHVELIIDNMLYAGTILRVGKIIAEFTDSYRGPMVISESLHKRDLIMTDPETNDLQELSKLARITYDVTKES